MKKRFYIYKSGTLVRQDNSLAFITIDDKIYIPINQVEILFIFGHCSLNKEVLNLLNVYKVSIYFFNYYGNYIGTFQPKEIHNGSEIIAQYDTYNDENKKRNIVIHNISSSTDNILSLLKYYNKKGVDLNKEINDINELKNKLIDISSPILIEAAVKKVYYSCFNKIIKNKEFKFNGRTTYPPKDEVNAVMSYGYSILYSIIENSLYRAKLDPSISYVHGISRTSNKLQYDIADILKPIIIDRLIFRLINKKEIRVDMFDHRNDGVYLNKTGNQIFIKEFEILLDKTVNVGNKSLSYRSIITKEVHLFKQYIINNKEYKSFKMEW